jgi:hypothetical protein
MGKFELQVKWPLIVTEFEKIYFNRIDLGNYTMFRALVYLKAVKNAIFGVRYRVTINNR